MPQPPRRNFLDPSGTCVQSMGMVAEEGGYVLPYKARIAHLFVEGREDNVRGLEETTLEEVTLAYVQVEQPQTSQKRVWDD